MDNGGTIFGWSMGHKSSTQVCSINKKTIWSVDRKLEWNRDTLESEDRFEQRKMET